MPGGGIMSLPGLTVSCRVSAITDFRIGQALRPRFLHLVIVMLQPLALCPGKRLVLRVWAYTPDSFRSNLGTVETPLQSWWIFRTACSGRHDPRYSGGV